MREISQIARAPLKPRDGLGDRGESRRLRDGERVLRDGKLRTSLVAILMSGARIFNSLCGNDLGLSVPLFFGFFEADIAEASMAAGCVSECKRR